MQRYKLAVLLAAIVILIAGCQRENGQQQIAVFSSGFEPGDIEPTWQNSVDWSDNVSADKEEGGLKMAVASTKENQTGNRPGKNALRYAGHADGGAYTHAYFKVFDVNVRVTTGMSLRYFMMPEQDNGRFVAVDLLFSDGTTLRDSGSCDQEGRAVHPASGHGGSIPLKQWSEVVIDLGEHHLGKTIKRIWVAYDRGGSTGTFSGYMDDISLFAKQPAERKSKVVQTNYPTEDFVVADFDVTDYGADRKGKGDATTAIQQAIDDAYSTGGGTVWMPKGKYRITDSIAIRPFVTLRGDWRDPDENGEDYGTVIVADVPSSTELTPGLFRLGGSAGVIGLTVYYPGQNAENPLPYPYTFEIPGRAWQGEANLMAATVKNVTLLNAYQGIGASLTPNDRNPADKAHGQVHETAMITNVKGTALKNGLQLFNGAEVGTTSWVRFSNAYWAAAGNDFNAPDVEMLNKWTRENGTAYIFGDLEFDRAYRIEAEHYKTGIQLAAGQRASPSIEIAWAKITDTDIAVEVYQNNPDGLGLAFSRSILEGSRHSLRNWTKHPVKVIDSRLRGSIAGDYIEVTEPGSPVQAKFEARTEIKPYRAILYDVTRKPYQVPNSPAGTFLPAEDATAGIQRALDDAGREGGGIVYVPAGWYQLKGRLIVPAGVELRGSSPILHRDQQGISLGTVLMAYDGHGTSAPETAEALITLNGKQAGVAGLRVFYPENNPAVGIVPYPYTIRGNGSDIYVVNVMAVNSYNGIDLATFRNDRHYIKNYLATQFHLGIHVGDSSEGRIEETLMNGNMVTRVGYGIKDWVSEDKLFPQVIVPITRLHTRWIVLDGARNEQMLNNFTFGAQVTYDIEGGSALIVNGGADGQPVSGHAIRMKGGIAQVEVVNLFVSGGSVASGSLTIFNSFLVDTTH